MANNSRKDYEDKYQCCGNCANSSRRGTLHDLAVLCNLDERPQWYWFFCPAYKSAKNLNLIKPRDYLSECFREDYGQGTPNKE